MDNLIEKHGVKVGQIYISADGSKFGHIVTDVTTYAGCDDVVTKPFSAAKISEDGNRIDAFKLSQVRYYLVEEAPSWMPKE